MSCGIGNHPCSGKCKYWSTRIATLARVLHLLFLILEVQAQYVFMSINVFIIVIWALIEDLKFATTSVSAATDTSDKVLSFLNS